MTSHVVHVLANWELGTGAGWVAPPAQAPFPGVCVHHRDADTEFLGETAGPSVDRHQRAFVISGCLRSG
jgi:hypothetical protein